MGCEAKTLGGEKGAWNAGHHENEHVPKTQRFSLSLDAVVGREHGSSVLGRRSVGHERRLCEVASSGLCHEDTRHVPDGGGLAKEHRAELLFL